MQYKDVFFFDAMLTPKIITFVYWLLLLSSVSLGLRIMFGGFGSFTFGKFLFGLVAIAISGLFSRIGCELLIVLFKIHENLKTIALRDP